MVLATDEEPYLYRGRWYVRRPQPTHFPADGPVPGEGEPVPETGRHVLLRTALFLAVRHALRDRALVTTEQFVYWEPKDPRQCVCPDLAVRIGGPPGPVDVWKTWELGAPHVLVEIVSDHDRPRPERERKFRYYERAGVAEVVWFDPTDAAAPVRLFDLFDGDLVERALSGPESFRSEAIGAYWRAVPDTTLGMALRLATDAQGRELLPTPEEAAHQQHAKEAERAREAERAKEAEQRAREAEQRAKEAALARVRELEAELARRS